MEFHIDAGGEGYGVDFHIVHGRTANGPMATSDCGKETCSLYGSREMILVYNGTNLELEVRVAFSAKEKWRFPRMCANWCISLLVFFFSRTDNPSDRHTLTTPFSFCQNKSYPIDRKCNHVLASV